MWNMRGTSCTLPSWSASPLSTTGEAAARTIHRFGKESTTGGFVRNVSTWPRRMRLLSLAGAGWGDPPPGSPRTAGACGWLLRRGRLAAMLPGVYSSPDWREHSQVAIRGALLAHPDGILVGGAAARVSYWPGAPLAQDRDRRATEGHASGWIRLHSTAGPA